MPRDALPQVPQFISDWTLGAAPDAAYRELIRLPTLAVGRFTAPTGHEDSQDPHTEDEVYFVVAGEASLIVGDEVNRVEAGFIAYVPAGVRHRFTQITDHLEVLVFFARPLPTATQGR